MTNSFKHLLKSETCKLCVKTFENHFILLRFRKEESEISIKKDFGRASNGF